MSDSGALGGGAEGGLMDRFHSLESSSCLCRFLFPRLAHSLKNISISATKKKISRTKKKKKGCKLARVWIYFGSIFCTYLVKCRRTLRDPVGTAGALKAKGGKCPLSADTQGWNYLGKMQCCVVVFS